MAALEKGITRSGEGFHGKTWNILGQVYFPKAVTDSTFAFETNSEPGQFVPVHIHPTQDEFILVQEGVLDLKLDGVWVQAKAGDLVRMPRGIPHGYFNKSDKPARALFWVSPMQKLEALFDKLHNLTDPAEVVKISAQHEVDFLWPSLKRTAKTNIDQCAGMALRQPDADECNEDAAFKAGSTDMVSQKQVCVIGAGVSGLAAAKAFAARGHKVTIVEKSANVGGVWDPSRAYPDVQTQSPKISIATPTRRCRTPIPNGRKARRCTPISPITPKNMGSIG